MPLFRIEFSDGGRARGGTTLQETQNIMEDLLMSNTGTVGSPVMVASEVVDDNHLWEVWELKGNRAMILGGYGTNPHPNLIYGYK